MNLVKKQQRWYPGSLNMAPLLKNVIWTPRKMKMPIFWRTSYEDEQLFEKYEDPETTWGSPDDELYYQEEPWTDDFNPQLEEACATHLVVRNYYPAVALQGHAAANCPQNKGSQSPKRAKTETATKNTGQAFMMHDLNQNGEPHVD